MIKLTIWGQPTTKKNSMRLICGRGGMGRPRLLPSREYETWMKNAESQVLLATAGSSGLPIEGLVEVTAVAYRHTNRKIDLANMLSAVDDMLQAFGIVVDDAQIYSHDGSRIVFGVPEKEARVEITINEES